MKRINELTQKPFKSGETREDGYLFYGYTKRVSPKTGYFVELWLKPSVYHTNKLKRAKSAKAAERHQANVANAVDSVREIADELN